MMQFFRSAAKPIILVTTIAFFIWLVYDLSGLGGGGGMLTTTSVGKVNGQTVDSRTFQAAVQQATDNRQRQSGASLSLEEVAQVRDQVWEQFIQDIIFRAEYDAGSGPPARSGRGHPRLSSVKSPKARIPDRRTLRSVEVPALAGLIAGQATVPYLTAMRS
jgi:hypothetical protein